MFSNIISGIALILSLFNFWYMFLRKGKVELTRPMFIAFSKEKNKPKIYLRALIFSTSKRGHIIENMFIKVNIGSRITKTFCIWAYGEQSLARGSGIFIEEQGSIFNHHFLLPYDESCEFIDGDYELQIYASILGKKKYILLKSLKLVLDKEQAKALKEDKALYFDWVPDEKKYSASIQGVSLNEHR